MTERRFQAARVENDERPVYGNKPSRYARDGRRLEKLPGVAEHKPDRGGPQQNVYYARSPGAVSEQEVNTPQKIGVKRRKKVGFVSQKQVARCDPFRQQMIQLPVESRIICGKIRKAGALHKEKQAQEKPRDDRRRQPKTRRNDNTGKKTGSGYARRWYPFRMHQGVNISRVTCWLNLGGLISLTVVSLCPYIAAPAAPGPIPTLKLIVPLRGGFGLLPSRGVRSQIRVGEV